MAVGGKGLGAVHTRGAELASERKSFGLRKSSYEFRWDGNKPPSENKLYLRILGDDVVISTQMHRFVPLPPTPQNPTPFFNAVCPKAYPIGDTFCYICDVKQKEFEGDNKAKKRAGLFATDVVVALAVEMVEDKDRNGVFKGYKPKMVDFDIPQMTEGESAKDAPAEMKDYRALLNRLGKPGTKVQVPGIGLMIGTIQGQQALFDVVTRKTTISDRVFEISKHGTGLDTRWEWDHDGSDKEMPDPAPMLVDFLGKYPFELPEEWALRSGAQERYTRTFKLGEQATATEGEAAAPAPRAAADDEEPTPVSNSREQLMARLSGKGRG